MPEEVCAQAPGSGSLWGRIGEKWGCQLSTTPSRVPFLRRGKNGLFLKVKELTIANCWDKMEIPGCGFRRSLHRRSLTATYCRGSLGVWPPPPGDLFAIARKMTFT